MTMSNAPVRTTEIDETRESDLDESWFAKGNQSSYPPPAPPRARLTSSPPPAAPIGDAEADGWFR